MCQVQAVPPILTPPELRDYLGVLKPISPIEDVPVAFVRSAAWIDGRTLIRFCTINKARPTVGTGKKNAKGQHAFIKRDWATALVDKFFPGETLNEKLRMIEGLVAGSPGTRTLATCPETVVKVIKSLDAENCDSFPSLRELADTAQQQIESAKKRGILVSIAYISVFTILFVCICDGVWGLGR